MPASPAVFAIGTTAWTPTGPSPAAGTPDQYRRFLHLVDIRLINADGSPAEISGNGTRCVAAYVCSTQGKERIAILTGAGPRVCVLTARRDSEYEFETEMGKATVGPELAVNITSGEVRGIPVSMGNPHFVIIVPEFTRNWQSQAAEIQRLPQFPEGVNVEYVVVDSKFDLRARFFERGAERGEQVFG